MATKIEKLARYEREVRLYAQVREEITSSLVSTKDDSTKKPHEKEKDIRDLQDMTSMLERRVSRLRDRILSVLIDEAEVPLLDEAIALARSLHSHKIKAESIRFKLLVLELGVKSLSEGDEKQLIVDLCEKDRNFIISCGSEEQVMKFNLILKRLNI